MKQRLANIFLTCTLVVFILSFAVVFTLLFKPLYFMDMELLRIPETSGYSAALIRENYSALIAYNSIWNSDELILNGLSMSPEGRIHFAEVRTIFVWVQALLLFSAAALTLGFFCKRRRGNYGFLKWGALISLGLPLVLGLLISLNWQWFFVAFHRLAFRNDYWIFDPARDPIISILPNAFFLHCALLILGITLLLSGASLLLWRALRHKRHSSP